MWQRIASHAPHTRTSTRSFLRDCFRSWSALVERVTRCFPSSLVSARVLCSCFNRDATNGAADNFPPLNCLLTALQDVGVTLGGNSDDDDRASNGDVTEESGEEDDVMSDAESEEGSSASEDSDSSGSEAK